jgi:Tfp pilus assembly protein PilV
MQKNKTNGLLIALVLAVVILVGAYYVVQKTYLSQQTAKTAEDYRSNSRSLKTEAELITTPAIDSEDNLSEALKELDSQNPDKVVADLSDNEADSRDF